MAPRVPPRPIAAGFRLLAATRAGWVLAALVIVEHAVVTAEYFVRVGEPRLMLLPLLTTASMAVMLGVLAVSPNWMTALAYLSTGAIAIAAYVMLMAEYDVDPERILLIGTMGTALCLAGAASVGPLGAALWTLSGAVLTQVALMGTQVSLGLRPIPDEHALIIGALYLATYLLMWRSDRVQRTMVDTEPIDAVVRREERERHRERQAAVVVHETVLRDLALIAHGPLQLTDFDRSRLRRDLDEMKAWRSPTAEVPEELPGDDFYDIIRELQWRGLSVDVGGNSYALELLRPGDREALLGAMRAALDNVLEHSGETTAEVFIDQESDRLTVMVVDEGIGFDPESVADDRLGLRMAIIRRIEDHGGRVTVWASPGAGTSVVMSLPAAERAGIFA